MKLKQKKRGYAPLGNMPASVVVAMGDNMDDAPVFGTQSVQEAWELITEEGFEGVGVPPGWGGYGHFDFDDTTAPITGAKSLLTDGSPPDLAGQANYEGFRHRQLRMRFKFKFELPSTGYLLLSQFGSANYEYAVIYLNMQNQLEISGRQGSVKHPLILAPNTVYEVETIIKGLTPTSYHSIAVDGGEVVSVEYPALRDLIFINLNFSAWCKVWWDDIKLEGIE